MRRTIVVLGAAALALAGCGSGSQAESEAPALSAPETTASEEPTESMGPAESTPEPDPTASTASEFPSEMLPRAEVERVFIEQLESSGFIPRHGDAQASLELADLVCVHFNRGGSMRELLETVMPGAEMSEAEFREFATVSGVAFCPERVRDIVQG